MAPLMHRAIILGADPVSFLRGGVNFEPLMRFGGHMGPEAIEQAVTVAVLRSAGVLFHAAMNGSAVRDAVAAESKATGLEAGVPDLMIYPPLGVHTDGCDLAAGVALEFKAPASKPKTAGRDPLTYAHVRPDQVAWITALREREWRAEVVYSAEQAIDVLREEQVLPAGPGAR